MSIVKSLCWGGSLILLAVGNASGLVSDASASVMFAIIPALALVSLGRAKRCGPVA